MAKKFFNYRFQIQRTKNTGIIFIIFVLLLLIVAVCLYKSKSNITKVDGLRYKVTFGMNEFSDNSCSKAYRINTEKKTCSTICIKVIDKDENYLKSLRKTMKTNGFTLTNINTLKVNGNSWKYFKTEDAIPVVSYYVIDKGNKTYAIEFIDQKSYLVKEEQEQCDKITNKVFKSIKVK